jgi:hypothetical protein
MSNHKLKFSYEQRHIKTDQNFEKTGSVAYIAVPYLHAINLISLINLYFFLDGGSDIRVCIALTLELSFELFLVGK